jgi:hypothetical protein
MREMIVRPPAMSHEYNGNGHRSGFVAQSPALPAEMPVWKQVLLWIAVLPGALISSTVVFWIANLMMWFTSSYYDDDSWFDSWGQAYFAQILPNGGWGYALVFCAAYIAPRAKITVAIVFAAVCLSLVTLSSVVCIRDHKWLDLVGVIALLVGGIIAAVSIATGQQDVGQREV